MQFLLLLFLCISKAQDDLSKFPSDTTTTNKSSFEDDLLKIRAQLNDQNELISRLLANAAAPGPQGPQGPPGPPGECDAGDTLQTQIDELRRLQKRNRKTIKAQKRELEELKTKNEEMSDKLNRFDGFFTSRQSNSKTSPSKTQKPTSSKINRCNQKNDCDPKAVCTNTEDSYECTCPYGLEGDGKTCQAKAVLALNTWQGNKAMVLSEDGSYREPQFTFDKYTEVYASSSIVWQNEMYVYGGETLKRQISRVTDCALKHVFDLPFNFYFGDSLVAGGYIYLCFSYENSQRCYRSTNPKGYFEQIMDSNYFHMLTRVAASNAELFAVGCYYPVNNMVESYDFDAEKWKTLPSYPYGEQIHRTPVIFSRQSLWVFGGSTRETDYSSTIARYDIKKKRWSRAGTLNRGRKEHGVIEVNSKFLVIAGVPGGDGWAVSTEKCELVGKQVNCSDQEPTLSNFDFYPELFYVPNDFCV